MRLRRAPRPRIASPLRHGRGAVALTGARSAAWSWRGTTAVPTLRCRHGAIHVVLALDAPAAVADRSRCCALSVARAAGRPTLEVVRIADRLGRRTLGVRQALDAAALGDRATRRGRPAVGVGRAAHAPLSRLVAERLARPAVGVRLALDARAGGPVADLRVAVARRRVRRRACRVALVVAREARRGRRSAIGVRTTSSAASADAEAIARRAVGVGEALDTSEGRVALATAARAGDARARGGCTAGPVTDARTAPAAGDPNAKNEDEEGSVVRAHVQADLH